MSESTFRGVIAGESPYAFFSKVQSSLLLSPRHFLLSLGSQRKRISSAPCSSLRLKTRPMPGSYLRWCRGLCTLDCHFSTEMLSLISISTTLKLLMTLRIRLLSPIAELQAPTPVQGDRKGSRSTRGAMPICHFNRTFAVCAYRLTWASLSRAVGWRSGGVKQTIHQDPPGTPRIQHSAL